MSKASEAELGFLHGAVAKQLRERIESGEATASDFSNAIKLLKDNNITCLADEDNALGELENALNGKAKPDEVDLASALDNIDFSNTLVN